MSKQLLSGDLTKDFEGSILLAGDTSQNNSLSKYNMTIKRADKPIIKYLTDFLEYLEIEKGLGNKTQETYSRLLNKFFNWLKENNLQDLKPHQLTDGYIWKYRVFLSRNINKNTGEPLKRTTQNHYLIVLRNLLNFFTDRDIQSLPAEKIKLAKQPEERSIKFLNLDQVRKLLSVPNTKTITGLRDKAILESLFSTGMRVAELVNLNRDQIKIKSNTKDLEISIVGKGNRPRTVYLSERAVNWLRKYLERREGKERALFVRYKGPKDSPLRLTSRSIENIAKKYAIKAGVPIFTVPHTLRHSMATDLLSQGVDLRTIQEFLGHKSISSTQIYTHVTSKKLREIHRKFHGGRRL